MTYKTIENALFFLNKIGTDELRRLIRAGDVLETMAYVQDMLRDGQG